MRDTTSTLIVTIWHRIAHRASRIAYRLWAIGYRLSAIGYRLSAIGYRLSHSAHPTLTHCGAQTTPRPRAAHSPPSAATPSHGTRPARPSIPHASRVQ